MDYAVLPPEVNSARMYAGAGSGPLATASAAWQGLAAELNSTAVSYQAVLAGLTAAPWMGPSSISMVAAATPYVSWLASTATMANHTANQIDSAIAAFESAFAATVPPAEIEVNRALSASLVATNAFGQNSAAIAAAEAQYAQMWAQDAAAMYGYAGSSSAATTLIPLTEPPQTTNAPAATQSTLPQLSDIPNLLQSLSSGGSLDPLAWLHSLATSPVGVAINRFGSDFGNVATEFSGVAFVASGITPFFVSLYPLLLPPAAVAATSAVAGDASPSTGLMTGASESAGATGGGVSAGLGEATTVGRLSVPKAWGASSPAVRLTATALPVAGLEGAPQDEAGGFGSCYGLPPIGSLINAPRGEQSRFRFGERQKVVPALTRQPAEDDTPGKLAQAPQNLRNVLSSLSQGERDELDKLRKEISDLATERDAAARLIKEALF